MFDGNTQYVNFHDGYILKNENSTDELGSCWIEPKYITNYLWAYLCSGAFWEDSNGGNWNDSNTEFGNFIIEAREYDNHTQRTVTKESDRKYSYTTAIRKNKSKTPNSKKLIRRTCNQSLPNLEYPIAPSVLWTSSNKNASNKNRFQRPKTQYETDPRVLRRRQKQINCVKSTKKYKNYLKLVPKLERIHNLHVFTPKKQFKYSRRSFNNRIKIWRKRLHDWYPHTNFEDIGGNYSRTSLNQISTEYGYPTSKANPNEGFGYFNNKYSTFQNYSNEPSLNQILNECDYPINITNPNEEFGYFNSEPNTIKNGFNGLMRRNFQMKRNFLFPEHIEKFNESSPSQISNEFDFENEWNGPIQNRVNLPVTALEKIEKYDGSGLNQISSKCNYPIRTKSTGEEFKYFSTMYNEFENDLNRPIQMRNHPDIYSDKTGGKWIDSSLNPISIEYGYPVSRVNPNDEFEYFVSKYGLIEMRKHPRATILEEITKYHELNLNKISSKYCYPNRMENANEEFKYNSMYSEYKNDLNRPIQMRRNPLETYYEEVRENCNDSSSNQISNKYGYQVNPCEGFEYINNNYSKFENDYNALTEIRRHSPKPVPEEIEKYNESSLNQIPSGYNYPIRIQNTNEKFKHGDMYSECENYLDGPIEMWINSPETYSKEIENNCKDSNLNRISREYYYPVNPDEGLKYFDTEYNAFENDFNGLIQMRRYPFQDFCPVDRVPNNARILKETFSPVGNCINRILLDRDPKSCNLPSTINLSRNKVDNIKNKTQQKFLKKCQRRMKLGKNKINYKVTLKNRRNSHLHSFAKESNLKCNQQSQKDLMKVKQQSDVQKYCAEECNSDKHEDIWSSPLYVIDECNESDLPLQEEEEIINFNTLLRQGEDESISDLTVMQKHFKRETSAATFTCSGKRNRQNNESDSGEFQNNAVLNYVSPKQNSWQKLEWDSSSSTTSSESEVGTKRSWKNFERN